MYYSSSSEFHSITHEVMKYLQSFCMFKKIKHCNISILFQIGAMVQWWKLLRCGLEQKNIFLTRFESQSGHHNVINYKARIVSILNNNNNPLFYECNVGYVYFTTCAAMSKLV